MDLAKRVVVNDEILKLKFYINGCEENEGYFREIGRFDRSSMDRMVDGETIEKDGNRFCVYYEDADGHQYTVNDICIGNM